MLTLTLANNATVEIKENTENAIRNIDELDGLFSGAAYISYPVKDNEAHANPADMLFNLEPEIDPAKEYDRPYQRVKDATWNFAESYPTPDGYKADGFKGFVQDEMNKHCKENVYWCHDVIIHGCAGGTVPSLIYTSDCLKVLAEHPSDIELQIQEIAENIGLEDFMEDFSFDKLVWLCFEQTVRDVLSNLQLDDI